MFLQFYDLSAILTVFFCGIVMSHYTWHNVTESSRVTTKWVYFSTIKLLTITQEKVVILLALFLLICRHAFATLSFISEIFIFLYVGMDALDIEKWRLVRERYIFSHSAIHLYWYLTYILTIGFHLSVLEHQFRLAQYFWVCLWLEELLLSFPCHSYPTWPKRPQTKRLTLTDKYDSKLYLEFTSSGLVILYGSIVFMQCCDLQVTIWWAGLMRGAVSMALAYNRVR